MTVFDLLFILLFLLGIVTLLCAALFAAVGKRAIAGKILIALVAVAVVYVGAVYGVTAASKPAVSRIGEPQCNDDWCLEVAKVEKMRESATTVYDVTLRIFSRARRAAQREAGAKDVYLVDDQWNRYNPILTGSEIALSVLLQPGESVATARRFELPSNATNIGLKIDHRGVGVSVCLIIGECDAFHKGRIIRFE